MNESDGNSVLKFHIPFVCTFDRFQLVLFGCSLPLFFLFYYYFLPYRRQMNWICALETGVGVSIVAYYPPSLNSWPAKRLSTGM